MLKLLIAVLAVSMTTLAAVKVEKTNYHGWPNSYRITNGTVELIALTDVGPRIIRYGFVGGQNLFKEFEEQLGKSGESTWEARGGHRLWMSPEDKVLTYAPDNSPVQFKVLKDGIELTGPVEKETGLQKTITVHLASSGSEVTVLHRIANRSEKTLHIAPWSLTMMAQGGHGITGFPPRGSHDAVLGPTNPLVMWAYTDFSDPRWHFTKKYLTLQQDPHNNEAQKTGIFNIHSFGAYLLGSDLFIKQSSAESGKPYPDFNCSYEMYTDAGFLEMETLGPLSNVKPGASVNHTERWSLHKNVHVKAWTDGELDRVLSPLLKD